MRFSVSGRRTQTQSPLPATPCLTRSRTRAHFGSGTSRRTRSRSAASWLLWSADGKRRSPRARRGRGCRQDNRRSQVHFSRAGDGVAGKLASCITPYSVQRPALPRASSFFPHSRAEIAARRRPTIADAMRYRHRTGFLLPFPLRPGFRPAALAASAASWRQVVVFWVFGAGYFPSMIGGGLPTGTGYLRTSLEC